MNRIIPFISKMMFQFLRVSYALSRKPLKYSIIFYAFFQCRHKNPHITDPVILRYFTVLIFFDAVCACLMQPSYYRIGIYRAERLKNKKMNGGCVVPHPVQRFSKWLLIF